MGLLVWMPSSAFAQESDCELESIEWMLADWIQEGPSSNTEESWRRINETTFEGSGRVVNKQTGSIRGEEQLAIISVLGSMHYVAKPNPSVESTPFKATVCTGDELIVTNPEHDFPRRLEYHRVASDSMIVHVSDGEANGFTLRFRKVSLE